MKFESRKILLLLDNEQVHPIDVQYSNIELFYFPPNVTSLIQPLDQGIIKNFKIFYKKEMQRKLLFEIDDDNNFGLSYLDVHKKITLFDAFLFTKLACDSVECKTIENCFSHAFKNAEIADFNDRVLDESEDCTTAIRTADLDDQLFLEQIYIYIYIYI